MTCELKKLNPLDALKLVCNSYPGGVEALAGRIGMSPHVLRNKLSHGVTTHHVNYPDQFSALVDCLEEANVADWDEPLQSLAYRHGFVMVRLPQSDGSLTSDQLALMVCKMMGEVGDVATAISEAYANGQQVDTREFEKIDGEVRDALTAIVQLREKMRAVHESGIQQGLVR